MAVAEGRTKRTADQSGDFGEFKPGVKTQQQDPALGWRERIERAEQPVGRLRPFGAGRRSELAVVRFETVPRLVIEQLLTVALTAAATQMVDRESIGDPQQKRPCLPFFPIAGPCSPNSLKHFLAQIIHHRRVADHPKKVSANGASVLADPIRQRKRVRMVSRSGVHGT